MSQVLKKLTVQVLKNKHVDIIGGSAVRAGRYGTGVYDYLRNKLKS